MWKIFHNAQTGFGAKFIISLALIFTTLGCDRNIQAYFLCSKKSHKFFVCWIFPTIHWLKEGPFYSAYKLTHISTYLATLEFSLHLTLIIVNYSCWIFNLFSAFYLLRYLYKGLSGEYWDHYQSWMLGKYVFNHPNMYFQCFKPF